jgi:hypothetical protein
MNGFALNHHPDVTGGVCAEECASLLSEFFAELRIKRKQDGEERKKWKKS